MRTSAARIISTLTVAASVILSGQIANAQQTPTEVQQAVQENRRSELNLKLGAGNSDNINRTFFDPVSSTYRLVGLVSDIARNGQRVDAELVSDIEYRDYSTNLENEFFGTLNAQVEFHAIPDRMSWIVANEYGQGRLDPFDADRPENRTAVNIFSTGPAFTLPVSTRSAIEIAGMHRARSIEDTPRLDSDVLESRLGFVHSLNSTTELGFNVFTQDVEYDQSALNFDVTSVSVGYARQLASGSASVVVGTNEVDYGFSQDSGGLVDINWTREIGIRSNIAVSLQQNFEEAVEDFRYANLTNVLLSADAYERKAFTVQYSMDWGRNTATVSGQILESRYVNETVLDNDEQGFTVNWTRQLGRQMNMGVSVFDYDRDFTSVSQSDKFRTFRIFVQRTFSGRSSVELALDDFTQKGLQIGSINEQVFRVSFNYAAVRSGVP